MMPLPSPTSSPGPSRRTQQLPFVRRNGPSTNYMAANTTKTADRPGLAAAQERHQVPGGFRAAAATTSTNPSPMCLDIPDPDPYPTRLFPYPPKRKRYSLDEPTFQIGKVRANNKSAGGRAHINIIPPPEDDDDSSSSSPEADFFDTYRRATDWDKHLDPSAFDTLPSDLQSSLREALTVRTVSARKASSHIIRSLSSPTVPPTQPSSSRSFDLISAISSTIDILVLVASHLRPRDILALYSISRPFHATLNTHLQSSVLRWAERNCPLASGIFPYQFYVGGMVPDPMGRPADPAWHDIYARLTATASLPSSLCGREGKGLQETRNIPSLRWLQMVHARHTRVRDIIACLARQGHRLPPDSDATLLKLWLVSDLPTNVDRCKVMNSTSYFTRYDLYRSAVFLVKLLMRTNDPLYGPDHAVLMELMLGQKGLTPLWRLLRGKGFRTTPEVVRAKMRYDVRPTVGERAKGLPVLGVEVEEMGRGHLEGWGSGKEHLLRVDELIARECARRGIEVGDCLESMAIYGHVDIAQGKDLAPSLEEIYMSDEEMEEEEEEGKKRLVHGGGGNVPFNEGEWTPKLVRKARWEELTERERKAIEEDDRDEMLGALRWEEHSRGSSGEEESEESEEDGSEGEVVVDRTAGSQRMDVFDDDSVLGGNSDDDGDDISDDESPDGWYGNRLASPDMPELQSRVTSFNSMAVMTPPRGVSPDFVGIQGDQDLMMDMDLDDENGDSTLMPGSLTPTPLKFAPSRHDDGSGEEDEEEDPSDPSDEQDSDDDDLDDEERQREAAELDEELLAQADEYYSEDELEYDWDAWKERADLVIRTRDRDDDAEVEEETRGYHRMY